MAEISAQSSVSLLQSSFVHLMQSLVTPRSNNLSTAFLESSKWAPHTLYCREAQSACRMEPGELQFREAPFSYCDIKEVS